MPTYVSTIAALMRKISGWRSNRPEDAPASPARNPGGAVTCEHLQPVELAIRAAKVRFEILSTPWGRVFSAECKINEPALRQAIPLPRFIGYLESSSPQRDGARADIVCHKCLESRPAQGSIRVRHPDEALGKTPWFPIAP